MTQGSARSLFRRVGAAGIWLSLVLLTAGWADEGIRWIADVGISHVVADEAIAEQPGPAQDHGVQDCHRAIQCTDLGLSEGAGPGIPARGLARRADLARSTRFSDRPDVLDPPPPRLRGA